MEKNYSEFTKLLGDILRAWLPEEAHVDFHETIKNNGVTYQALAILEKNQNVSPNIRLDGYFASYCEGMDIKDIATEVFRIYETEKERDIDITYFTDFSRAKSHIMFRLVNYDKNKARLEKMPHVKFLDLALVYYFEMDWVHKENGQASVQIEKEHLAMWEIDEGALYDLAMQNTMRDLPALYKPMCDVVLQIMEGEGIQLDPEDMETFKTENADIHMYVLSNPKSYFGASVMYYPNILKEIALLLKSDLIVLPSSVHEVIILPQSEEDDYDKLNEMIVDINMHQVAAEEVLSNHFYYYDKERDELRIPEF